MKKISVVIPTYKRPEYLSKSMRSVEAAVVSSELNKEEIEIIVIDNGCSSETEDMFRKVASELCISSSYFHGDIGPRSGPATSRNKGIHLARGDIIYLLDDDDQFYKNRFLKSLPLLLKGDSNVVMERSLRVYEDETDRASYITGPESFDQEVFYYLLTGGPNSHITPGATAFTKEIYLECGGYDNKLRFSEDGELLLRLCLYGKVALLGGDPVCRISIHAGNDSRPSSRDYWQTSSALACLYAKIRKGTWPNEKLFMDKFIAEKLDYHLTRLRYEAISYSSRIFRGLKCLYYFPFNCLTFNNCKSIGVWLLKSKNS